MATEVLYALGGAVLAAAGLYVLVAVPHLLRKVLGFNVMASGIFLMLVGLGHAQGGPDPIPQAMVLTGIVVAFGSTALALVLLRRWFEVTGRATLEPEHAYGAYPDQDGPEQKQEQRPEPGDKHR